MTLGGGETAQLRRAGIAEALRVAKKKACGVKVAGPCHIHHLWNGNRRNHQDIVAMGHDAAEGRACHNCDFTILAQRLQGAIKILRQVKRLDFSFIGKDDIDVLADEFEKALAVALDAEGIGECDRREPAGLARDFRRQLEGLLGFRPVPEIAFHVGDPGGGDDFLVDIGHSQMHAGAEIGVHGALALGRDQNKGARRGRAIRCGLGFKAHALGPHVVGIDAAELIGLHLAEIGRLAAEGSHTRGGVSGRAAGNLDGRPHAGIERLGARLIDQVH